MSFFITIPFSQVDASGEAWLDGWNYRKSHTIANSTGAGTNYQVKINVHVPAGTDSGDDVYVGLKSQVDLDDIRFTDNDGETLLDSWIEEESGSDSLANDGGVSNWNYPTAIFYNDKTYVVWIDSGKDIMIQAFNHTSEVWGSAYTIDDTLAGTIDYHWQPVIAMNSSNYLFVWYGAHVTDSFYYKISSNPEDESAWESRQTMSADDYTYPSVFLRDTDNKIYMIYRSNGGNQDTIAWRSYDGSWSGETTFVNFGDDDGLYCTARIFNNNIYVIWSRVDRGLGDKRRDVYFAYSDDGCITWKNATGDVLETPLQSANTLLETTTTYAHVETIALDSDGYPVIAYHQDMDDDDAANLNLKIVRWDGAAWNSGNVTLDGDKIICTAGDSAMLLKDSDLYIYTMNKTNGNYQILGLKLITDFAASQEFLDPDEFGAISVLKEVHDFDEIECWAMIGDPVGSLELRLYGGSRNYCVETYSSFWVEVQDNLSSSAVTIYMYYGNDAVSDVSNGVNTFIRWDDFDLGYSVNDHPNTTRGWSYGGFTANDNVTIQEDPADASNLVCEIKESSDAVYTWLNLSYGITPSLAMHYRTRTTQDVETYVYFMEDETFPIVCKREDSQDDFHYYADGSYNDFTPELDYAVTTWYEWEYLIQDTGKNLMNISEGSNQYEGDWWNTPSAGVNKTCFFNYRNQVGDTYIDDVWIRNYVNPEPIHGAWGSEKEYEEGEYIEGTEITFSGGTIDGGIGWWDLGGEGYPPEDDGDYEVVTDNTEEEVGQSWTGTTFLEMRSYVSFDTSSLPDDANVSSLILSLQTESDNSTTNFEVVIYGNTQPLWGSELTIDDWECGTEAFDDTWNTGDYIDETYFNFTIPTDQCNTDGNTQFMVASDREMADTEPTDNEYVSFYMAEHGTPKLYVTYTTEEPEGGMTQTIGDNWLFANEWHEFKTVYNYVGNLSAVKMAFSDLYDANQVTFDGDTDYISVTSSGSLNTTSFTVSFWVYPNTNGTAEYLVSRYGRDGWAILKLANNRIQVWLRDETGDLDTYNSEDELTPYARNYVCVQYDDDEAEVNIYIGTDVTTHTEVPHGFENQQTALEIGGEPWMATSWFNGTIDEVKLYNTTLSAAEVNYDRTYYQPEEEFYSDLKLWFHFDEGTGATIIDSSTNGNDGSFQDDATWGTGGVILEDPHWAIVKYDLVLDQWSLESGTEIVGIKTGTYTKEDDENVITFNIFFKDEISDRLDVNIYSWSMNVDNYVYEWDLFAAEWFHIYKKGGFSTLETSGTAGRSTGGEVFELYASTSGSWARANTTIRKLQHMHTLVSLGVPKANGGYCIDNAGGSYAAHTYTGYFEFGIDYLLDHVWTEGWKCRIEIDDALIHSTDINPFVGDYNFVQLNVTWWYKGELMVSNDIIYAWYEGFLSGEHDVIMVWVDLWFNTVNASSTVGGRVAAYRNGWANKGAIIGNITQSMFFTDLVDENNQTFSASRLDLMNLYAVVNKTGCNHLFDLRDYDLFNKLHAEGEMIGIETPIFVAPKDPDMPATGFLQPLWTAIKGLTDRVAHAITLGALGLWEQFVQFLDTAFSLAGFPNGFSIILGIIQSFFTYMIDGIGYAISLLQSMFLLMASWLSVAITHFTSMATGLLVIFDVLAYIYAQAELGWVSMSSFVTPLLGLIPLALIVWILNARNFEGSIKRVKILWDLLASVVSMFLRIADLVWNYITGLIEGVPVVE